MVDKKAGSKAKRSRKDPDESGHAANGPIKLHPEQQTAQMEQDRSSMAPDWTTPITQPKHLPGGEEGQAPAKGPSAAFTVICIGASAGNRAQVAFSS